MRPIPVRSTDLLYLVLLVAEQSRDLYLQQMYYTLGIEVDRMAGRLVRNMLISQMSDGCTAVPNRLAQRRTYHEYIGLTTGDAIVRSYI